MSPESGRRRSWRWPRSASVAVAAALTIAACGLVPGASDPTDDDSTGENATDGGAPSASAAQAGTDSSPTPAQGASAPPPTPGELCAGLGAAAVADVADTGLTETSGLAAATTAPDLLWAHNDSGSEPALHGIGLDGAARGRVALAGITPEDPEDLAVVGGTVYLADIGDNNATRPGVSIYRFPEPTPDADSTAPGERLDLVYPSQPTDAEAFLVDPITGQLVIIGKTVGFRLGGDSLVGPAEAPVFVAEPAWGAGPITLTEAGSVALDDLDRASAAPAPDGLIGDLGVAGVATGADISADGTVIALRTYRTVWLFARDPARSVAEALAGTPCEAPSLPEAQGEAIAFLPGAAPAFATVSEGVGPPLHLTRR
ncbi:MAG: hypothetical protein AAGD35_01575 [Actinomycetota bacterium]